MSGDPVTKYMEAFQEALESDSNYSGYDTYAATELMPCVEYFTPVHWLKAVRDKLGSDVITHHHFKRAKHIADRTIGNVFDS